MDIIDRNMKSLPDEVRFSLITLLTGTDEDIELLLPDQLDELKRIAKKSRESADMTVEAFTEVKNVLEELIAGGKVTEKESSVQVQSLDLQIDASKKRKEMYEKQKKEAKERKEEIKKKLDEAEKKYEEALDSIPTGWTMIGMSFVDNLANTFNKIIGLIPNTLDNISNMIFGSNGSKPQKSDNTEVTESLEFPSCKLTPAKGSRVTITDEVKVGTDFAEAITNMKLTVEFLDNYINKVFDEPPKFNLSLVPDAVSQSNTVKKLLAPNKQQIESTKPNSVPVAMKGTAIAFYKKIFSFMDKVIKTSQNRKTPPEEIKKLYDEGQELNNNGACFHSWLNRLLDLPPVTPKKPFDETQSKEMTITQRDSENAKRRVEEWKGRMEEKEKAFKDASERLLIVSSNITETIIKLSKFNADKATLQEVLQ